MRFRFAKSIRWRLLSWLAFLLAGILTGFGVTAYQLYCLNQFSRIDDTLLRRVAALNLDVRGNRPFLRPPGRLPFGPPPGFQPPDGPPPGDAEQMGPLVGFPRRRKPELSAATIGLFDQNDTNSFYFALWSRDGDVIQNSTNTPGAVPFPERSAGDTQTRTRMRGVFREAYQFTELGDCVLAGRAISSDLREMRQFGWWLAAAGATVLALGLGGGWVLATGAIRPVREISAAAGRISAGKLSDRINITETDSELGRLANILNSTFARLEAAFAEQKRFTADASHELRTPLAVIITEAQSTLARERGAAEYRETVASCLETAQRMRRLIESLLELSRFDADQENLRRGRVDLAEATRDCVDLLRPLAAERSLNIHCDLQPVPVLADTDRLSQVISNLLTNAIHYNRDGGEINLHTGAENSFAILSVSNTGQGIKPEDLSRVFERFYRGDESRSQTRSGTGLGLAIAKAIVEAHGGSIEVVSQPEVSATFTIRFPRADSQSA